MTNEERSRRTARAEREVLVIARIPEGFKVYSPTDTRRTYTVSEAQDRLVCSCPDFEKHAEDPEWRCKHVIAVARHHGEGAEQGRAEEASPTASEPTSPGAVPPAQMFLKRSVSPDGRIDSLSVGVSWPLEGVPASETKARIEKTLRLQAEVVSRFLADTKTTRETKEPDKIERPEDASSQAAPARMLGIGGMDGRWGRRLFLTFDIGGRNVRLFGTQKQLAAAIADAGYPDIRKDIAEGLDLGLPCRVVTKPTADGRFVNVEQVLPPQGTRR